MHLLLLVLDARLEAEDGIRDRDVTGVQTCALPISKRYASQSPTLLKRGAVTDLKHTA